MINDKNELLERLNEGLTVLEVIKSALAGDALQYEVLVNEMISQRKDIIKTIEWDLL